MIITIEQKAAEWDRLVAWLYENRHFGQMVSIDAKLVEAYIALLDSLQRKRRDIPL